MGVQVVVDINPFYQYRYISISVRGRMFLFEVENVTRFITMIYEMIILLLCACEIYELIRLLESIVNNYCRD